MADSSSPSSFASRLPNELLLSILSQVDSFAALLACRRVSRQWLACVDDRHRRAWPATGTSSHSSFMSEKLYNFLSGATHRGTDRADWATVSSPNFPLE